MSRIRRRGEILGGVGGGPCAPRDGFSKAAEQVVILDVSPFLLFAQVEI